MRNEVLDARCWILDAGMEEFGDSEEKTWMNKMNRI